MISTLPKGIKIVRWLLILMGTLGIFLSLFQAMVLYDAWRSYQDPFPTIVTLPFSILLSVFYFILAEKLHRGKAWAWYVSFWVFVLFTTGDLIFSLLRGLEIVLLVIAVFHGLGAYLLHSNKEDFMSFATPS